MSLYRIAEQDTISKCDKKVANSKYCHSLRICIIKKVDKKYPTYGGPSDLTVFERLSKFGDIVDITQTVIRTDLNRFMFLKEIKLPTTHSFSSKANLNQSTKIEKDGSLEILIKGEHEW